MKFRIDLKIIFFLILFCITKQLKIYLIIMGFALLHEFAHLLIGIILKFKPKEMELMPFGFYITLDPKIEDYKVHIQKSNIIEVKRIFVAIAGPLLNLIFLIFFAYTDLEFKQTLMYSNLVIFTLNLIPIYPLDGGRILQSIFRLSLGIKRADKVVNVITNIFMIFLTICGSIAILYFKNIAIVLILVYLWDLVVRENKRFELKEKAWKA